MSPPRISRSGSLLGAAEQVDPAAAEAPEDVAAAAASVMAAFRARLGGAK